MTDKKEEEREYMREGFMTPGARSVFHRVVWALIVLFALDFILTSLIFFFLAGQVNDSRRAVEGSCSFFGDIATAALPLNPPAAAKPSKFGVGVLLDSRRAYRKLNCRPELPPPGPALVEWASFYHLPVS